MRNCQTSESVSWDRHLTFKILKGATIATWAASKHEGL